MERIFTDEMISKINEIFGNREDVFKKQYIDLNTSDNRMKAQDIVNHVFYMLKEGRIKNQIDQLCLSNLF